MEQSVNNACEWYKPQTEQAKSSGAYPRQAFVTSAPRHTAVGSHLHTQQRLNTPEASSCLARRVLSGTSIGMFTSTVPADHGADGVSIPVAAARRIGTVDLTWWCAGYDGATEQFSSLGPARRAHCHLQTAPQLAGVVDATRLFPSELPCTSRGQSDLVQTAQRCPTTRSLVAHVILVHGEFSHGTHYASAARARA